MIKFRAWDKVINQMFVPDSIHFDLKGNIDGLGSKGTVFGIEDFVLMQSTGLHDKNGKEIFEGDIVNIQFVVWDFEGETEKEYKNAVIYFDTYGSQLSVPSFYIKDEYGVRLLSELAFYDENIEIIGNIHQHPELLGEPT